MCQRIIVREIGGTSIINNKPEAKLITPKNIYRSLFPLLDQNLINKLKSNSCWASICTYINKQLFKKLLEDKTYDEFTVCQFISLFIG